MSLKNQLKSRAREIIEITDEINQEILENPELEDCLQELRKCITCGSYEYTITIKKNTKEQVIECSDCFGSGLH